MRTPLWIFLFLAAAFAVPFPALLASEAGVKEIRVPYGVAWGDSIEKIREMIAAVKAREISTREPSPGKTVIEAEGLGIGENLLRRTLFSFREGSLVEVEMQYGDPSWDGQQTVDFFDRTRRRIDERYGHGILLANQVKQHPDGDGMPADTFYTLIVYRWSQPAANLELEFYELQDQSKSLRLVSLHYKTP